MRRPPTKSFFSAASSTTPLAVDVNLTFAPIIHEDKFSDITKAKKENFILLMTDYYISITNLLSAFHVISKGKCETAIRIYTTIWNKKYDSALKSLKHFITDYHTAPVTVEKVEEKKPKNETRIIHVKSAEREKCSSRIVHTFSSADIEQFASSKNTILLNTLSKLPAMMEKYMEHETFFVRALLKNRRLFDYYKEQLKSESGFKKHWTNTYLREVPRGDVGQHEDPRVFNKIASFIHPIEAFYHAEQEEQKLGSTARKTV
jgi:hypothetical protein